MKFAAIAPTKVLLDTATGLYCRPLQFCLAHIYMKGGPYAEFYRGQVHAGKEVILDNGEHEGQRVGFLHYWACVQDLKPTVVVLPDAQENHYFTKKLHEDFMRFVDSRPSGEWRPQFMAVLHAEGEETWELLSQYINTKAEWVGFPNNIADCHGPDGRVVLAKQIQSVGRWKSAVRHHALGWNGDSYGEWAQLAELGFHSCDSSNPVWRGALGNKVGDIDFGWDGEHDPIAVRGWVDGVDRICES